MNILLIDDSSTMRRILKTLLKQLNLAEIVEAENQADAFKLMSEKSFQLVFVDSEFSGGIGIDFLRAVRANKDFSKVPILITVSDTDRKKVVEVAKELDCGILVKPFTLQSLKEKISKHTKQPSGKLKHVG